MTHTGGKRIFGLDIVRAVAITLVLLAHVAMPIHQECIKHLAPSQYPDWMSPILKGLGAMGFLGVEIFFVLSGFLIGQILLKQSQKHLDWSETKNFWIRRWFRTLPLYYLILIALIAIHDVRHHEYSLFPQYFFFVQNFYPEIKHVFNVSWSLAIEEWFYLLLPLLLLAVQRGKRTFKAQMLLITFIAVVISVTVARSAVAISSDISFDQLRRFIPLRLDVLMIGVLLALLKVSYPDKYALFASTKVFGAGLAGVLSFAAYLIWRDLMFGGNNGNLLLETVGFPLLAFFIALVIPFLDSCPRLQSCRGAHVKIITAVSTYSYAMYVVHHPIISFMTGITSPLSFTEACLAQLSAIALTVITASILYHFFERPITNLREKFAPAQTDFHDFTTKSPGP